MKSKIMIFVSFLIYGCQNVDINDKDKRNENWIYWVDSSTGEASWITVSDQTTVKNGRFTSFFKNGKIYEKGKFKNGECIDTIYCYDINENLQKYVLVKPDTLPHYYIREGSYVAYFQSGKILEKGIIKNHRRGDRWTRYFENGKIEFIHDFKDGNGLTLWYYDNGQISDSAYTI
jgi:antitoxin component YwqK of YwqJK toxin-antitoxin module